MLHIFFMPSDFRGNFSAKFVRKCIAGISCTCTITNNNEMRFDRLIRNNYSSWTDIASTMRKIPLYTRRKAAVFRCRCVSMTSCLRARLVIARSRGTTTVRP